PGARVPEPAVIPIDQAPKGRHNPQRRVPPLRGSAERTGQSKAKSRRHSFTRPAFHPLFSSVSPHPPFFLRKTVLQCARTTASPRGLRSSSLRPSRPDLPVFPQECVTADATHRHFH